jgi:hypothetical protein
MTADAPTARRLDAPTVKVAEPAPTPPPPPGAPPLTGIHYVELAVVTVLAFILRYGAVWALGEGAPFGPDGTGAEAAVHLGGHLYPLHIEAIRYVGDARTLSLLTGTLTIPALYLVGHRNRLTGAGVWMAATLPLAVYPSALAAGDAPALFVAVLGALLATFGRAGALLGGALAMACVAVKPIAAPALALLLLQPVSLIGAAVTLPFTAGWLEPLWSPRDRSGLLGSWWPEFGNAIPADPEDFARLITTGLEQLASEPMWVAVPLAGLAVIGSAFPPPKGSPDVGTGNRVTVLVFLLILIGIAGAFGDRLSPRYYAAVIVPMTLWAGFIVPRPLALILVIPTFALVTQVGIYRGEMDRGAEIPELPHLEIPPVDARLLFDESSTRDATRMREEAARLAKELPHGATYRIEARSHGREGETVWPLKVARPDVRIVVVR